MYGKSIFEASTHVLYTTTCLNIYTEFTMLISSQNTELETLQTLNIYVYESFFFSNFISTVWVVVVVVIAATSADVAVAAAAAAAECFVLCIR